MATILLAWEQGGGLGHLMRLRPLARFLLGRGHRVVLALRDLSKAVRLFGPGVELLQAPFKHTPPTKALVPSYTFAHILHNIGFEATDELAGVAMAWRGLFQAIRPNLVVFDHAPTALLGARGLAMKRAVIGTGFTVPPDESPLPNLCSWLRPSPADLAPVEEGVRRIINAVLEMLGEQPIARVMQLYSEVDEQFLTTFPELDHNLNRPVSRYWGARGERGGQAPVWPDGKGKKVFAYLKSVAGVEGTLAVLKEAGQPTLVYIDRVNPKLLEKFSARFLRFTHEPLDLLRVSAECDLAILNGTHAATATMLLGGKPTLQLPVFLEQMLLAQTITQAGFGVAAKQTQVVEVERGLDALLASDRYENSARTFATRYTGYDPVAQNEAMGRRVEELMAGAQ